MISLVAYKVALLALLAGIPTSVGASAYYNQQQTAALNNHVSDLSDKLNSADAQVSTLNHQVSDFNNELSQLQSQNLALQNQVNSLQSQLASLNSSSQNEGVVVSKGQISLTSNNGFQRLSFTVPPNVIEKLNLTYSTSSQGCLGALSQYTPCSLGASLFNPTQFDTFSTCNCVLYGNYTASTWSSPLATSYGTRIVITAGAWVLVFYPEPGVSSPTMILVNETVLLSGPFNLTTQTTQISSRSLSRSGYGAAQYVSFMAPAGVVSSSLNISFSASGGYSIRLALLSQDQYNAFLNCNCVFYGNYTTTTWISPVAQSYAAPVTVPSSSGAWYLAFMEPPGTGSGTTISETIKLTVQSG